MPFCGGGQTFWDLFDYLDGAVACFEQIYPRTKVIKVKWLVTTSVGVGLDGASAQVIYGITGCPFRNLLILFIRGKLEFVRAGQFAALRRSVRIGGYNVAILE